MKVCSRHYPCRFRGLTNTQSMASTKTLGYPKTLDDILLPGGMRITRTWYHVPSHSGMPQSKQDLDMSESVGTAAAFWLNKT